MRYIALLALVGCGGSKADSGPAIPEDAGLRFVAIDNGLNQVLLVDELGGDGWSVTVPTGPRDVALMGDDAVLVSVKDGAIGLSLVDGSETLRVDGFTGVESAESTATGLRLFAQEADAVVVIDLDAAGVETARRSHAGYPELRLARTLANGNLLFTTGEPFRVVELDPAGTEVWTASLPGKGYVAERLSDGGTLATTGADQRLVELDAGGGIVRSWGGKDAHPEAGLDWFSGFQVVDDLAVCANWLGHGTWGTGPHLVAFDGDNALVWQWEDHDAALQITNLLVLDVQGL